MFRYAPIMKLSFNPGIGSYLISYPMKHSALIKKLLAPRQMEYLTVDQDFMIVEASFGAKRFTEIKDLVGADVRQAFPELMGMEDTLVSILTGTETSYEIKGIIRNSLYFDLFMINGQDEAESHYSIIICLEDVTEKMTLRQELVQRANEASLLLNALTASKDYVEKIVASMADAMLVTNVSGLIKKVNHAAQDLFGYSETELLSQSITMLAPDRDFLLRFAADGLLKNVEITCQSKAGSQIIVAFSCSIIQTDDGSRSLVYIGRDVSDRRQVETELQTARIKAEEASQAKSAFLANMSHEIRTPMNGVLGMSELLLDTSLSPEQRDLVSTIQLSGNALLNLINEILDLSKLEAEEVKLEVIDFDLAICIEEVLDLLAPQAHKKGLEINALIDPDLPTLLQGDPSRLRQILTNFVGNAIKFTAHGEVVVRVERVDLAGSSQAELRSPSRDSISTILFSIIDTGIGITPDQQKLLFTPFSQVDVSTTRKYGGTGLGLAICKQLVSLMGGNIGVESPVSAITGSRFWFTVPFLSQPLTSLDEQPDILSGRSLLIVDDNISSRTAVSNQVIPWGMSVDGVESATAAMTALQQKSYDAVLISLHMPKTKTDSIGLASQIKSHPTLTSLPLILLVNTSQRDVAQHCQSLGFSDYLPKPVRSGRLRQLLQNLLNVESKLPVPIAAAVSPSQYGHLRVLVADDNLVNQKVTIFQLRQLGYQTDVAANGAEVLELMTNNSYDFILMDCQMPILDGYATTQAIRDRELTSDTHTIIIAMTASAMTADRDRCLAAGMDDYLSKPCRKEQLREKLAYWLSQIGTQKPSSSHQ